MFDSGPKTLKILCYMLKYFIFIVQAMYCDGFTAKKPYIVSPNVSTRKIFGIFDIVHILKNFVNALMDKIALLPDGHFVSKEDWEELLPLISTEISPGYRLTQRQLDAKGSARMEVSRATTIMSHHVAGCFQRFFPNDPVSIE